MVIATPAVKRWRRREAKGPDEAPVPGKAWARDEAVDVAGDSAAEAAEDVVFGIASTPPDKRPERQRGRQAK